MKKVKNIILLFAMVVGSGAFAGNEIDASHVDFILAPVEYTYSCECTYKNSDGKVESHKVAIKFEEKEVPEGYTSRKFAEQKCKESAPSWSCSLI